MFIKIYCRGDFTQNQVDQLLKQYEGSTSEKVNTYQYTYIGKGLIEIEMKDFHKFLYTVKWIDDFIDEELRKTNETFWMVISETKEIKREKFDFENCLWIKSKHGLKDFQILSIIKDSRIVKDGVSFEFNFYSSLEWSKVVELKTLYGIVNTQVVKTDELTFTLTWVGKMNKENLNVRIHHQCETSEIHGSEHCDCREQLKNFQTAMYKGENHLLIYCHEEGRGAGLFNKINAYHNTQIYGDDTVEAFERMGLKVEQRNFEVPADILFQLRINSINIWTNNPLKYQPVMARGIKVNRVSAWYKTDSIESKTYMSSKKQKMGHISNDFYTIALIATAGKRDMTDTINSIVNQTIKVDQIIIASEIELSKSPYKVLVNPYEKGLARNTMQALSRIKIMYPNKEILVGTIDDDDEWDSRFVERAKQSYEEGYNFITGFLEVYKEGVVFDKYSFKQSDMKVETFVYGNPGVHGSNKFFNLDIALESGGMMKHVNASTDRTFNINLLSHPEVKPFVIEEVVCKYHKDDSRDRITNDPKRLVSIQNFYESFANLIDEDKIEGINKRHWKLHNLDGAIKWK